MARSPRCCGVRVSTSLRFVGGPPPATHWLAGPLRRGGRIGRAGGKDDPARLRAENQRLARELAKSQAVVEIMGKLQGLLESVSESTDTSTPSMTR